MKIKNKMKDVRAIRDNGEFIEVGPGEIIEVSRPELLNKNVFEVIDDQKRNDKKTLDNVKKEQLKKEDKK